MRFWNPKIRLLTYESCRGKDEHPFSHPTKGLCGLKVWTGVLTAATLLGGCNLSFDPGAVHCIHNDHCQEGYFCSAEPGSSGFCIEGAGPTDEDGDDVVAAEDCDDNDPNLGALANDADCDGTTTSADCDDLDADLGAIGADNDCDGVATKADCDDQDPSLGATEQDLDCDGALSDDDCDDNDPELGEIANDADCDGALTAEDCNDSDPESNVLANDADCDGILAADDCDDLDPTAEIRANDADCDGVLTADDCNDTDANSGLLCGVTVAPGTFMMGCTQGQSNCSGNESPAHSVTLTNHFWMAETEVTQAQWLTYMGNNPSAYTAENGYLESSLEVPVESVGWWESLAFANALSVAEGLPQCYSLSGCQGTPGNDMECEGVLVNSASGSVYECAGYRLPTEAEWEYAARAGTDFKYAGSDNANMVAWYSPQGSSNYPYPVAGKEPNSWGLYDMSGNIKEWVWDWFDSTYYQTSPSTDPEGPTDTVGFSRTLRGGSAHVWASICRVSTRDYLTAPGPGLGSESSGLRVVKTLTCVDGDADCDGFVAAHDCDDTDSASTVVISDADCDGVLTAEDCDDTDATKFPGNSEVCGDGIDQNCDGIDSVGDADGDGYIDLLCGGTDCDDNSALAQPYDDDGDGVIDGCGWRDVSVGEAHACGIDSLRHVHCWGAGTTNGDCSFEGGWECGQSIPAQGEFTKVQAKGVVTCGLTTSGSIECWGGQPPQPGGVEVPPVTPPSGVFVDFGLSGSHGCAIAPDGALHCWGDDGWYGQATPPPGAFVQVVTSTGFSPVSGSAAISSIIFVAAL